MEQQVSVSQRIRMVGVERVQKEDVRTDGRSTKNELKIAVLQTRTTLANYNLLNYDQSRFNRLT